MSRHKYFLLTEDGYVESMSSYVDPYDMFIFNKSDCCNYNIRIKIGVLVYHSKCKIINFIAYCHKLISINHKHIPDLDGEYLWNNSLINLRYDNPELFNRLKYIRDILTIKYNRIMSIDIKEVTNIKSRYNIQSSSCIYSSNCLTKMYTKDGDIFVCLYDDELYNINICPKIKEKIIKILIKKAFNHEDYGGSFIISYLDTIDEQIIEIIKHKDEIRQTKRSI